MKKLVTIVSAVMMLLMLAACAPSNSVDADMIAAFEKAFAFEKSDLYKNRPAGCLLRRKQGACRMAGSQAADLYQNKNRREMGGSIRLCLVSDHRFGARSLPQPSCRAAHQHRRRRAGLSGRRAGLRDFAYHRPDGFSVRLPRQIRH